jgi:hypothetical protein
VNVGASLTLLIVIEKCWIAPPSPALSTSLTETSVVPWPSVAGVNVSVPPGEIAGWTANREVVSATTV